MSGDSPFENPGCNESDPFWEYEQYIHTLGEQQLSLINQISENVAKAHDRVREFAKETQCETFQEADFSESSQDYLDTTQART